jgi:hypothetical protein
VVRKVPSDARFGRGLSAGQNAAPGVALQALIQGSRHFAQKTLSVESGRPREAKLRLLSDAPDGRNVESFGEVAFQHFEFSIC